MLFSYKTAYIVAISYTPYQLVFGLHPLMPTEYMVPIASGNERDNTSMRVLICIIIELKKLQAFIFVCICLLLSLSPLLVVSICIYMFTFAFESIVVGLFSTYLLLSLNPLLLVSNIDISIQ
jgi:hypothetical protein